MFRFLSQSEIKKSPSLALSIKIYENGTTLVESLNKDDSGMSKKNATSYANTIYFDGETGTRYRVEVSVFAEDAGGDSDSRSKTVTLTAK